MEKNQRLTDRLMASPDAAEWACSWALWTHQLACLDAYELTPLHLIATDWMPAGVQDPSVTLRRYFPSTEPRLVAQWFHNVLVKISSKHLLLLPKIESIRSPCYCSNLDWESMSLISIQLSSTVKCLKTKQSIFPNLLATLLRVRKTCLETWQSTLWLKQSGHLCTET